MIATGPSNATLWAEQICRCVVPRVVEVVRETEPKDLGLTGYGWTPRKLRQLVGDTLGRVASPSTLHRILKAAGLSWMKCKKLLGKRNPAKRAAFLTEFVGLYERFTRRDVVLVYRDLDLGWSWGRIEERLWRKKVHKTGFLGLAETLEHCMINVICLLTWPKRTKEIVLSLCKSCCGS